MANKEKNAFSERAGALDRIEEIVKKNKLEYFTMLSIPIPQKECIEIPAVILTVRGIYCLDICNFEGEISPEKDPDYWKQQLANGQTKIQVNPIAHLKNSVAELCKHFRKSGLEIGEDLLIPKVVFVNEESHLDSCLSSDEMLVTWEKLPDFISSLANATSLGYDLSQIISSYFLGFLYGGMTWRISNKAREIFSSLLSDIIELDNGDTFYGYYQECHELEFSREDVKKLTFEEKRSILDRVTCGIRSEEMINVKQEKRKKSWCSFFSFRGPEEQALPASTKIRFRFKSQPFAEEIAVGAIKSITLAWEKPYMTFPV